MRTTWICARAPAGRPRRCWHISIASSSVVVVGRDSPVASVFGVPHQVSIRDRQLLLLGVCVPAWLTWTTGTCCWQPVLAAPLESALAQR
jgi:hypothetical protein